MRVLVTGGAGFLGGHLLRGLVDAGRAAVSLDVNAAPDSVPGVEYLTGSLLDVDALAEAATGCSAIVNAAAVSDFWAPGRFTFDRINVLGVCRVLAVARRLNARVVQVSSYTTLVARDASVGAMLDEQVEVLPSNLLGTYPRTKRQADLALQSAAAAGVHAASVLPGALIGPGDHRPTMPGKLMRDLVSGRLPAMMKSHLNLVDVRSVASATIAAIDRAEPGERYLLTGEDLMLSDLVSLIHDLGGVAPPRRTVPQRLALAAARVESILASATGRPPRAPLTGVRLASRDVHFSAAKAATKLDFHPTPIADVVRDTMEWLSTQ